MDGSKVADAGSKEYVAYLLLMQVMSRVVFKPNDPDEAKKMLQWYEVCLSLTHGNPMSVHNLPDMG